MFANHTQTKVYIECNSEGREDKLAYTSLGSLYVCMAIINQKYKFVEMPRFDP